MQNITNLSPSALKVHPQNNEFFDDIAGQEYETFKKSIQEEGILTPLLVANDMTVISGHQRLKAAQDLIMTSLPVVIMDDVTDEDDKLKKLLAANFGRLKNDDAKQRKVAVEYVKLCGNKQGRQRCDNRTFDYDEIAKQLGTNKRSLQEALEIERKLTPEVKEILDAGAFTKTTASKILVKLTTEEQEELITTYGKDIIEGVTQKQMQEYVDQIKGLENKVAGYELKSNMSSGDKEDEIFKLLDEKEDLATKCRQEYERKEELSKENRNLKKRIEQLENGAETEEDSELLDKIDDLSTENSQLKQRIKTMEYIAENKVEGAELSDLSYERFSAASNEFILQMNDYTRMQMVFAEMTPSERKMFIKDIRDIQECIQLVEQQIEIGEKEYEKNQKIAG